MAYCYSASRRNGKTKGNPNLADHSLEAWSRKLALLQILLAVQAEDAFQKSFERLNSSVIVWITNDSAV